MQLLKKKGVSVKLSFKSIQYTSLKELMIWWLIVFVLQNIVENKLFSISTVLDIYAVLEKGKLILLLLDIY